MAKIGKKYHMLIEQIKINQKAIKLLNKISPQLVVYEILDAVLKAVVPYIEIVLSALIVNELTDERNGTILLVYVLLLVCGVFVLKLADEIFMKKIRVRRDIFAESHEIFLNSYSFDMDFEEVENAQTSELREQIEGIMDTENGGLKAVPSHLGQLCQNIVSGTIASIMCFNVLFVYKTDPRGLWITSNEFTFLLLVLVLSCTFAITILLKRQKRKMFQVTMEGTKYNRYIGYYLWDYLDDNKYAKDIRIFNQSEVISSEMKHMGFDAWIGIFKACEKLERHYGGWHSFILTLIRGAAYLFSALRALAGVLRIGDVMKCYCAVNQLITSVSGVASAFLSIENNSLYLKLVFEYMELGRERHVGKKEVNVDEAEPYLFEFHNVSFRYPGTEEYALKNFSLKIGRKERIAMVGMNGSGKTTMIKLLCGLYQPNEGYITLNDVNIDVYDYQQYRRLFSVVFQDFTLFSLPLGENIAAKNEYDAQRIWNIFARIGIKNRVDQLKYQLNHIIYQQFDDEGIDISGGEEQKIAIARALYRDAYVYILDEPTAALDPESEYEIYSKMDELTCGKTVLFISHRLSSCCYSDKIIVFDHGEMVQEGTHAELLNHKKGKYYELWNAQAKYYNLNLTSHMQDAVQ